MRDGGDTALGSQADYTVEHTSLETGTEGEMKTTLLCSTWQTMLQSFFFQMLCITESFSHISHKPPLFFDAGLRFKDKSLMVNAFPTATATLKRLSANITCSKQEGKTWGWSEASAAYLSQWVVAPRDLRVGVDVLQVPREGFALQGFPQRFPGRHIAVIHLHNTWNHFIKRNRGSKSSCHKGRHHQLANSLPSGPTCWHCYITDIYQH